MTRQATTPLGCAHFTAITLPPLDFITLAAAAGYNAVGLRLHPAFPGAPTYTIPAGSPSMRAVRDRLAATGLRVTDIEFVTIGPDFDAAALLPMLESAFELGASRISVCGDDPDPARFSANLAALCDRAAPLGLAVDLEIMPWRSIGTLASATAALAAAGRANAGLLVDALHLTRSGATAADLAPLPRPWLRSLQLCDAGPDRPATTEALIAEARGGRFPPGAGSLPLAELIAAMPADAMISVEVPHTEGPAATHLARVHDAARRLLAPAG